MHTPTIRLATAADAAQIQAIYAPIVSSTIISFELDPPTVDELRQRIATTLSTLPWLVCERYNMILGYAYAGPHRSRAAYQWSVDVSAYVHASAQRIGVGRALYTSLFAALRLQGFYNAYAGITLPNPASVGLHESLGFTPVGVYRNVGYKFGAWHDVGWWQRTLEEHTNAPELPLNLRQISASAGWDRALHEGLALLGS
jgi:phosphinothricin acetyltransferase